MLTRGLGWPSVGLGVYLVLFGLPRERVWAAWAGLGCLFLGQVLIDLAPRAERRFYAALAAYDAHEHEKSQTPG